MFDYGETVTLLRRYRFRWAVCQLHELQRLRGDREVVSKALKRLPKDLDETYERILLQVPKEDWQFVSHAFQWLWFYGELGPPDDGTPSVLLLDAIKDSTLRAGIDNSHLLYNPERLRELCGCLISSQEDSISFAHYTVKEYLDSSRICQGPLFFFSTGKTKVLTTCLDASLLQAQIVASRNLENPEKDNRIQFKDLWNNTSFHSLFYTMQSLRIWGEEISNRDDIYERVKRLLYPSTQFFRCVGKLGFDEGLERVHWDKLLEGTGFSRQSFAWTIDWNEQLTDSDASLFMSLFLILNDKESPLLSRLIREADLQALFSNRIVLKKKGDVSTYSRKCNWVAVRKTYEFDGPLIEVMVEFVNQESEAFHSLLVNHVGLYNPSQTLIHFTGHHMDCLDMLNSLSFCPLRHLLQVGAQPNLTEHPLTPLQIAVAARNSGGVRLLLDYGADPNCIGDHVHGDWPAKSMLAKFSRFHGMSPLRICKSGYCVTLEESFGPSGKEPEIRAIQDLLLECGGRDFQIEPSEPLTE